MLFKKNPVTGMDERRFTEIVPRRRKMIDQATDQPIVAEYGVNKLSKSLHPGVVKAKITQVKQHSADFKTLTLTSLAPNGRFPYFRAGQYVTVTAKIENSRVTRAYSLSSSPLEALCGKYEISVKRAGLLSSWLLDAPVGTEILVGEPSGDFHHDSLRDHNTIVAIAGGSGITPFVSMAKAIAEGAENFRLIVIYGVKTLDEAIVFPTDFADQRIKIVPVLSAQHVDGYEQGFVTAEIISKYAPKEANYFLCGPDAMYAFVGKELEKLGVSACRIRKEHNSVGDRLVENPLTFTLTVHIRDQVYAIPAKQNETVLVALERAGLAVPSRCRSGVCGFCHSKLIAGNYTVPAEFEYRRQADFKFAFIHPCCSYPDSDMEIDVPPLVALED